MYVWFDIGMFYVWIFGLWKIEFDDWVLMDLIGFIGWLEDVMLFLLNVLFFGSLLLCFEGCFWLWLDFGWGCVICFDCMKVNELLLFLNMLLLRLFFWKVFFVIIFVWKLYFFWWFNMLIVFLCLILWLFFFFLVKL